MIKSPDREAVKALFEAALEQDSAHRSSFLQERCSDASVRAEVEGLLAEHDQADSFLSTILNKVPSDDGAPAQRLSAGDTLAERFRIVRFIAAGGMGEVYEADDQELHDQVALKIIRPEILAQPNTVARFKREVHLARKVTHPNVCRIFDLFRHKSTTGEELVFISMELLHGKTLQEHLKNNGRLKTAEAIPIIEQMASGLAAAHAIGIVHRDFKPGNVMLVPASGGWRAVITDFGLALQCLPSDETASLSTGPAFLGTPAYMSPEQLIGQQATLASDIYALGLVIYEMVVGARPFLASSATSAALKRLVEVPFSPRRLQPELSPVWESVILRCLERNPAQRFGNAEEVAKALTLEGKQHRLRLGGLAVAAALILGAAGFGLYSLLHPTAMPFQNFTITQVTNSGKAILAAISPDGRYLLSVMDDNGLQSLWLRNVPTESDTQVIPPSPTRYLSLAFSPDGNFIYFRRAQNAIQTYYNLYRSPILGGTPQTVVRNVDSDVAFSPDRQHIVYMRKDDPEKLRYSILTASLEGNNEMVLQTRSASEEPFSFAWSPSGNELLYSLRTLYWLPEPLNEQGDGAIEIFDIGTKKSHRLAVREGKYPWEIHWSPDGRTLFAMYTQKGPNFRTGQIGFFRGTTAGDIVPITRDTNRYRTMTLSADGKTVATVLKRSYTSIYVFSKAGRQFGKLRQQLPSRTNEFDETSELNWSADGDLLLSNAVRLLKLGLDNKNSTQLLLDSNGVMSAPSSCGTGFLVLGWRFHDGNNAESVWRTNADGSSPLKLTDGKADYVPVCSPDQKWVYYYDWVSLHVHRVPLDGSAKAEAIFAMPQGYVPMGQLSVSPDAKMLATAVQEVTKRAIKIALFDLRSSKPPRMLDAIRYSGGVQFAPDGESVAYASRENGTDNVWLQPVDGSARHPITDFKAEQIWSFHLSPDGKSLGVLRGHYESDAVLLQESKP